MTTTKRLQKTYPSTFVKNNPNYEIEKVENLCSLEKEYQFSLAKILKSIENWNSFLIDRKTYEDKLYVEECFIRKVSLNQKRTLENKRLDFVDIETVKCFVHEEKGALEVYYAYKQKKTKAMIKHCDENPHIRAKSFDLSYYVEKYGEEGKNKLEERKHKNGAPLRIEYFLNKGLTLEEAKNALKNRQNTFSLEKCIERHGKDEGERIYNDRQQRWQNTLRGKSHCEQKRIDKSKGITLANMTKKYGEEGKIRYDSWLEKVVCNSSRSYSLESLKFFKESIPEKFFEEAFFGESEISIKCKDKNKFYFYDFTFRDVILEYHGEAFHPNPRVLSKEEIDQWVSVRGVPSSEALFKDEWKRNLAEKCGYKFFEIYSNDTQETKNAILKEFIEALESSISQNHHQKR